MLINMPSIIYQSLLISDHKHHLLFFFLFILSLLRLSWRLTRTRWGGDVAGEPGEASGPASELPAPAVIMELS